LHVINEHKVGIAEMKVCKPPGKLVALGLGSCVGVTLLDVKSGIGGMLHVMLPENNQAADNLNPFKYADTGIPLLLEEVINLGAKKFNLEAKIAGGAQMFKSSSKTSLLNIGERNEIMCKKLLKDLNIKLTGIDTGGNSGRTMILDCSLHKVFVRTAGAQAREI